MKPVKPYIDENRQAIFVEIENDTFHDIVNGILLGFAMMIPILVYHTFL